ncbi:hypothetical protein C2S52_012790 [Perilla frutescens var. hirtella]|nr:hypothetical protein C2S52_012790 [Perilla frutescens var. hirtella]
MTGVSFASAGSGFDPVTASIFNVIPMKKQLEYFRECKTTIEAKIGKEKTKNLIRNSAFVVSAGTNDLFMGYHMPFRKETSNITTYLNMLMETAKEFLQELRKEGARNVALVGLTPIGCVPAVLTLNPGEGGIGKRNCNDSLSSAAREFNKEILKVVKPMKSHNFRILYADIYKPLENMIKNPSEFGFEKVDVGCCGTGLLEMTFLCNPLTKICRNPSKYVFFDSAHPTEATYKQIFKSLRPTIDEAINVFSH